MQRALRRPPNRPSIARSHGRAHRRDTVHLRGVLVSDPDGPRFGASALRPRRRRSIGSCWSRRPATTPAACVSSRPATTSTSRDGSIRSPTTGSTHVRAGAMPSRCSSNPGVVAFTPAQSPLARSRTGRADRVLHGTTPARRRRPRARRRLPARRHARHPARRDRRVPRRPASRTCSRCRARTWRSSCSSSHRCCAGCRSSRRTAAALEHHRVLRGGDTLRTVGARAPPRSRP